MGLLEHARGIVSAYRWAAGFSAVLVVAAVVSGVVVGAPALFGILGVAVALAAIALLWWRSRRLGHEGGPNPGATLGYFVAVGIAVFLIIQLVPYGRDHTNPPMLGEPAWSSPQTRELMVNACFGCHSNEVEWPWYSNIAPISWVVTAHVDEGRDEVNYSDFVSGEGDADETVEVILEGSMPPRYYTVFGLHPEAKLTDAEIADLVSGLRLTPGMDEVDGD
ncbi:MAG: heme-binding domain-containing protein [bacterium]|nr:heme-binding domain-containing protein [bacterium]